MSQSRSGVALLELVTALMIVSVGLFGVIAMYQIGMGQLRYTQRMAHATRLIDNELETVRSMPLEALHEGQDLPWESAPAGLDALPEPVASLEIGSFPEHPQLKQLIVRLTWREGRRIVRREVVTLAGEVAR